MFSSTEAPTTASVDEATGGIEGLVITDEFMPIKGAVVLLEDSFDNTEERTTGESGRYAFSKLPPGDYTLTATRLGFFQSPLLPTSVSSMNITELNITLEKVPVAPPDFTVEYWFNGTMLVGTGVGDPHGFGGDGVDVKEFTLALPAAKEDGTLLAAKQTVINLNERESAPGGVDLDLYFFDPEGVQLSSSTSEGNTETIDYAGTLAGGDYGLTVYFWAGAAADFTMTVTVTFAQGEAAAFALKHADA